MFYNGVAVCTTPKMSPKGLCGNTMLFAALEAEDGHESAVAE